MLILKIPEVFLRLKSSSSLNLNKIEHFTKISKKCKMKYGEISFIIEYL